MGIGEPELLIVTLFMGYRKSLFIPFPSEVIVPPAAWKSMADDSMNIFLVVVFATVGADIGALLNYYLPAGWGVPLYINSPTVVSATCASLMKTRCVMLKSISGNTAPLPHSSAASFLPCANLSVFPQDCRYELSSFPLCDTTLVLNMEHNPLLIGYLIYRFTEIKIYK